MNSVKPRFTAEPHNEVFYVKDNNHQTYAMPEKAVSIYFKKLDDARKVANLLCDEWYKFLANPT